MRTLWLFLVANALGCAHHPKLLAHQASSWRELSSPHFTLATDLPEDTASLRLSELERAREALLLVWGQPGVIARVAVVAPKSAAEMEELTGDDDALRNQGFSYSNWFGQPTLIVSGEKPMLAQEATGALLARLIVRTGMPRPSSRDGASCPRRAG